MKYKCIKEFLIDEYDDNGAFAEKQILCEKDSIWEMDEIANRFIGDKETVRLIEISNKDSFRWMEISKEMFEEYFEKEAARKDYKTTGGWNIIECTLCGAKHNAGRAQNDAGQTYVNAEKAEWWAKHTGVPQDRYAITLQKEDVPQLCPYIQK